MKLVFKGIVVVVVDVLIKYSVLRVLGMGFIVVNGFFVIINYYVVFEDLDFIIVESYVVLSGEGIVVKKIKVEVLKIDFKYDLVLLKLDFFLFVLKFGDDELLEFGLEIVLMGFLIGVILGLYFVIYRGYIFVIMLDVILVLNSN